MDIRSVWTACLGELQQQMTSANFNMWLRDTEPIRMKDGCLRVAVGSEYARDWLQDRLQVQVERTLTGIVGQAVRVRFVVPAGDLDEEELPADVVAVRFYEYDPMQRGFLMVPKYVEWFWQPFLGVITYATYRFLRSLDRQNEGWGSWHFVSVERIAATVADGHRQAITGVKRRKRGREYWQKGAFDGLSKAAIAKIETVGGGTNVSYRVSCLNHLPLLVPEQVETLPEIVQIEHARFLKECDVEYEAWEQLELPSLVKE